MPATVRYLPQSDFYSVRPLSENLPWGVFVSGLNLDDIDAPQLQKDLIELWIREGVIIFKEIGTKDVCIRLSKLFGEVVPHPAAEFRLDGYPELLSVSFSPDTGALYEVDGEVIGSFIPWHKDLMYADKICRGGMLLPLAMPTRLGQTGFIDCISAYERLPQHLKDAIDGLHIIYEFDLDVGLQKFGKLQDAQIIRYSPAMAKVQEKIRSKAYPPVIHPMVFEQPETGKKVLNVSPVATVGILEMPDADGNRLLEEVMKYALDERFHYYHQYEMGELVLWDNWRMLHSSAGSPPDQKRSIVRTTILGDYGLGRLHPQSGDLLYERPDYAV